MSAPTITEVTLWYATDSVYPNHGKITKSANVANLDELHRLIERIPPTGAWLHAISVPSLGPVWVGGVWQEGAIKRAFGSYAD